MSAPLFFKWGKDVYEIHKKKLDDLEITDVDEVEGIFTVQSTKSKRAHKVEIIHNIVKKGYFARCDCEDFTHRRRICKHIVKVLYESRMDGAFTIPTQKEDFEKFEKQLKEFDEEEIDLKDIAGGEYAVQKLEQKIVQMADELDTQQILIDLTGSYEDLPMIYTFVDKEGNQKTVVSWSGYTKAALIQGNIKIEFIGFQKAPSGDIVAIAKAIDLKNNVEVYGIASRLPKKTKYTYEILASKAARNALKHVVDPDILSKVIEHAKKMKSVVEIDVREFAEP